jgi:peptidase E
MRITSIGGGNKAPALKETLDALPDEKTEVLLIPTACSLVSAYERKVKSNIDFFRQFGVATKVLHEFGAPVTATQLEHEIGAASLIYTIGGNTPYMLRTMREQGIDIALRKAIQNGKPHAGTSAGALLPFDGIHTNPSPRPQYEVWDFEVLEGLGTLRGIATAHANKHDPTPMGLRQESRREHLESHFPEEYTIGIAIENDAAVIFGSEHRIIRTNNANVYALHSGEQGVTTTIIEDGSHLASYVPQIR